MDEAARIAGYLATSQRAVVFTGAGISTESGIPDFRSPGGVWSKFDPEEFTYQRFLSSEESRRKYWAFSGSMWDTFSQARPNAGHLAIAELHRMGKLDCVITQNVDGLHQKAGVPAGSVIELHGTAWWVACLSCGQRYPRQEVQQRVLAGDQVPRCQGCGGLLKPATISFGQAMPVEELAEAERRARRCDLFIAAGSSLVVYPAAQVPALAKQAGARLAIINLAPTPYDAWADVVLQQQTGAALNAIVAELKRRLQAA